MIDFVVTSMTKLVIIVVLHLSIIRIKSEIEGTSWTRRKALLFIQLVRLLDFRWLYFFYLVVPIAVRVVKRLALEPDNMFWIEECLFQLSMLFLLGSISINFRPYDSLDEMQIEVLIKSIKGDAGLSEEPQRIDHDQRFNRSLRVTNLFRSRAAPVSELPSNTGQTTNSEVELVQT